MTGMTGAIVHEAIVLAENGDAALARMVIGESDLTSDERAELLLEVDRLVAVHAQPYPD